MANVSATFPRSFCAFASLRVFPASVCRVPALCAARAEVKLAMSAPQHNKRTKTGSVRKLIGIEYPCKIG
jgi:hypothetical protein